MKMIGVKIFRELSCLMGGESSMFFFQTKAGYCTSHKQWHVNVQYME